LNTSGAFSPVVSPTPTTVASTFQAVRAGAKQTLSSHIWYRTDPEIVSAPAFASAATFTGTNTVTFPV
jgi:hypothetical protein